MSKIDKFYQYVGMSLKKIFNSAIKRPLKNFNVNDRAQKRIENPKAAPWHESTQKSIAKIKKESNFQKLDMKSNELVDRLKLVKVNALNKNMKQSGDESTSLKGRLPQEKFGVELPFVFYKPNSISPGKITVLDTFDIILSYKKENKRLSEIASKYNILEEDVNNLIKYVGIFTAINKDNKEIHLFSKQDDLQATSIDFESDFKKEIADK